MRNLILTAGVLLGLVPFANAQALAEDPASLVENWYQVYLGRNASTDPGAILWENELRVGNGSTAQGYIEGLFRDVLGRQPTPAELDFWSRRMYTEDRRTIAYELLTQNPGAGVVVTPAAPPVVVRPDRDREHERHYDPRHRWDRGRDWHDYHRPHYPFRR
jgi:hypothetical protein